MPEIWGMSVTMSDGDLTFTLVASSAEVATLDGLQYAAGGPCVAAVEEEREVGLPDLDDPMVEADWQLFASASAAAGVRSTLSFPLAYQGQVIGGVNLYASTVDAFAGHEGALAEVFGAIAGQGVSNADMDFASRDRAEHGPARVAEQSEVDMALGVLMARHGLDADQARTDLDQAARRAGTDSLSIARAILDGLRQQRRGGH